MVDIQRTDSDLKKVGDQKLSMDWRRVLLGWGFLTCLVSVFIGGVAKAAIVPKLLCVAGLLMIAISAVALVADRLQSKSNAGKHRSAESRP